MLLTADALHTDNTAPAYRRGTGTLGDATAVGTQVGELHFDTGGILKESMKSLVLVGLQFSLIAFLIGYSGMPESIFSLGCVLMGVILGVWAVLAMRFRVSVLPEVRERQTLVVAGPYRFIRHPMYTAVLLTALGLVLHRPDSIAIGAWVILLGDLVVKLKYEEGLLLARFPDYALYAEKTRRLLPFLY